MEKWIRVKWSLIAAVLALVGTGCVSSSRFVCNGVRTGRTVNVEVGAGYANTSFGLQGSAESFCADEIGEACQCSITSKSSSSNLVAPSN
jgi:hypothetical protein